MSLFAGLVAAQMLVAAPAPSALATTQTAQSGAVSATFTFAGSYPNYAGLHLSIAQGGTVFYSVGVVAAWAADEEFLLSGQRAGASGVGQMPAAPRASSGFG